MSRLLNHAKRALTGILAVAMILTATPSYALAAEPDSDSAQIIENVEVVNEDAVVETSEGENTGETKEIESIEVNNNEDALQQETEEVEEAAAEVSEAAAEEGDELAEASEYTITITGENYSYQDGDGIEQAEGKYVVSKGATSITIKGITAAETYGIYKVTATIGGESAVVKKDVTNQIQNGDGDYIITADANGNTEITGDVVVNVETKHVHTVTFVDANENHIGVTPLPGGEISAFIPNENWDGTCKVFEGVDFKVQYMVPDNYGIMKVIQDGEELELSETREKNENGNTPTVYQAKAITTDSTISMYSSLWHEIPVTYSNAEVKWGVAEDAIDKNLDVKSKKYYINTLENDLYFTIDPITGYHVRSVTADIGESESEEVDYDEDKDIYKLTADQVKDCSGITIEIEENPALDIRASVDGESDLTKNKVTISGAAKNTSGDLVYYTAKNTAVVFKYTVPTGKEIDSFKLLIGGEEAEYGEDFTVSTSSKPFTVTVNKEAVTKAWDEEKVAISLSITTGSKEQTITFEGTGVTFKEYTRAKITDGVLDEGGEEIIGDAITSESVKYNDDTIYFVVDYDKENYDLVSVKQGSAVLKPQLDEYYADAVAVEADAKTESSEYYVTNKVTADAKVVATLKAKTAGTDTDSGFKVFDEADNSEFATKNAKLTDGVYVFNRNTNMLTFTVTSSIGYIPEVKLGTVDEDGKFVDAGAEELTGTLATDKAYTKRTYTYSIAATKAQGKGIQITDSEAPEKTVTVAYDDDQVTAPVLSINGKYVDGTPGSGTITFNVPEFSTVTVKAAAEDYYKLTKVVLDTEEQKAALKSGTLSFVVKGDHNVAFASEGIITIYTSEEEDEWSAVADKAKINLASDDKLQVMVAAGSSDEEPEVITAYTAKVGSKDAPAGFAAEEEGVITLDASKAQELGTSNTVKLTITGGFGTKTLSFIVAQPAKSIKVGGAKYDKETGAGNINQIAGTTARYKLTLTPKTGDYSRLTAKLDNDSVEENAGVSIVLDEKGNYCLQVETFKEGKLAADSFTVYIDDKDAENQGELNGGMVVVTPVDANIAAPTVKVSATTDIDATLTLALPKAAKDYANLWYKITGTANVAKGKTVATGMSGSVGPLYVPANVELINITLADGEDPEAGDGHAQKYDFEVSVLQLVENVTYSGNPITESETVEGTGSGNVSMGGSVKKVSASTKEPYYETKLGLTKKTTSFISGQRDILLAVPKYNSKTTYTQLGYADIIDADGKLVTSSNDDTIDIEGDAVILGDSDVLAPGKYTLRVWPANHDSAYKLGDEARVALTVKQPITGLAVSVPSVQVYKKANATATVKPTIIYNNGNKNAVPAVKKVTWSITDADGDDIEPGDPLFGKVSINKNSGVVSIAKDFVLSSDADNNKFKIKAVAADYEGNSVNVSSEDIEICSDAYVIKSVTLRSVYDLDTVIDLSNPLSSYELNDTALYVNGEPVDLSVVSVKANDSKNLILADVGTWVGGTFDEKGYGIEYISKSGTYKITVTANDGGKSSQTLTFKVKEGKPSNYSLSAGTIGQLGHDIIDFDVDTRTAELTSAPTYIEVGASVDADSVTKILPTLKIKSGAVKVSASSGIMHTYMIIRPTAEKIELELSYKDPSTGEKTTDLYTINIAKEGFTTVTAPKQLDIWANAHSKDYEFEFTSSGDLSTGTNDYGMVFDYTDDYYKSSKSSSNALGILKNGLNNAEVTVNSENKKAFTITSIIDTEELPKGTYKFYGVLTKKSEGGIYVPVSDPVEVKIVATAAKAPSAAIATGAISLNAKEGAVADIPFKTYKEVQGIAADEVMVYNNNNNGVVNRFAKYFDVIVCDDEDGTVGEGGLGTKLKLTFKEGVGEDDIKAITDSDLTGWVEYIVVGEDLTAYTVKCEKITVKLVAE